MPRDAWSNPSAVSAEDAARMAAFLEDRAACPDQILVNTALRDALAPRPGERIVEVGCGSGALCRLVVPHLLPDGEILGLDVAPDMIAAARALAGRQAGLRFEVGAGEALPAEDATCDAFFAARLLLHVADPLRVVGEMARVVKPGGRVVLMDWDWETVVVTHPDRELTRRLLHWRCDHHGGNNWSGRRLLGYALAAGLRDLTVIPVTSVALDEAAALTGSMFRAAEVARDGGAITPVEHDAWTGELRQQLAEGRFLASITYFIVRGERANGNRANYGPEIRRFVIR
ncbi:MAG: methyltransferase domain-containing protein [Chloroflexi bacterium]|nr:methyltransferase domain-containing protein [Chloroflexota bacterium]